MEGILCERPVKVKAIAEGSEIARYIDKDAGNIMMDGVEGLHAEVDNLRRYDPTGKSGKASCDGDVVDEIGAEGCYRENAMLANEAHVEENEVRDDGDEDSARGKESEENSLHTGCECP